ncbi:DUF72 domain-containing protein [Olivibacter ginsenosidimutans]|uniref:DUF72 domain-containing protein n=1 Tax=Olivibacter ginsenosidimutans TaxID=1176537 RepID=A0ABP9BAF2_9SPHI
MKTQHGKIWIGTSGWHYKHWVGKFYPDGTKDSEQLSYFTQKFKTVELNNSFYRLPSADTFTNWRKATPDDFVFAVKGSRYISHLKKLILDKQAVDEFLHHADHLKEKLGPILFQLPPRWEINLDRLATFLAYLPKRFRFTFEFRNPTWYTEETYELLRKHGCAFCIYELAGHQSPEVVTADFVYIRLHGPGNKYQGSYTDKILKDWAKKCKNWQQEGKDSYLYFDNDQAGYAAFNALTLIQLLKS